MAKESECAQIKQYRHPQNPHESLRFNFLKYYNVLLRHFLIRGKKIVDHESVCYVVE